VLPWLLALVPLLSQSFAVGLGHPAYFAASDGAT
jgi:hypothetical protein